MNRRTSSLVIEVLRQTNRENPADAVLKRVLRGGDVKVDPVLAREVAEVVHAYYRWFGWLNPEYPLAQRVVYAAKLQEDFNANPLAIADTHLQPRTVPQWVWSEMNITIAWLRALQSPAKLWLRCRPGRRAEVAEKLGDCDLPEEPADALIYRGAKDLFHTSGFRAGDFEVQDVNSQRVGLICDPQPGETWWDACAGEGGKTMVLSGIMKNKGLIWTSDRAEWRLKKLKQRAARLGVFNYRSVIWDGGAKPPTKTKFDGVLLDAPCSGLGTWQRNPQARWTTTPQDIAELAELQLKLLKHAAPSVKPGGKLVYAVCTLPRKETSELATRFERNVPGFERLEAPGTRHGFLLPELTGGNGMFVAVWRRKQEATKPVAAEAAAKS
jgi:16S rRNA (cytosine967-C5)-methyltransferase